MVHLRVRQRPLGRTCQALGEPAEAKRYHRLAEDLYAKSGNLYGLAHVADSMAELESAVGRRGAAMAHLRRAVDLHYEVGNLNYAAQPCRQLRSLLLDSDPAHPLIEWLSKAIGTLEDNRKGEAAPLVEAIANQ